jgi:hypothetical protein
VYEVAKWTESLGVDWVRSALLTAVLVWQELGLKGAALLLVV